MQLGARERDQAATLHLDHEQRDFPSGIAGHWTMKGGICGITCKERMGRRLGLAVLWKRVLLAFGVVPSCRIIHMGAGIVFQGLLRGCVMGRTKSEGMPIALQRIIIAAIRKVFRMSRGKDHKLTLWLISMDGCFDTRAGHVTIDLLEVRTLHSPGLIAEQSGWKQANTGAFSRMCISYCVLTPERSC